MANSKYEYVRYFERSDRILPNTWIVVRIDGRAFTKLTARYEFKKPNDDRALHLMNEAATNVLKELPEIVAAYGQSDEYSFVMHPSCELFGRRESKLVTTIVSMFTAYYVNLWPTYFAETALVPHLPSFDGRAVAYPSIQNLRDYLCWRQADCHINNLYNTTFWSLVNLGGLSRTEAEDHLKGTFADDKNEILFSRFGINYNNEPEMYKKGSIVFRDYEGQRMSAPDTNIVNEKTPPAPVVSNSGAEQYLTRPTPATDPQTASKTQKEKDRKRKLKARVVVQHVDIIRDTFWKEKPWILEGKAPKMVSKPD